MADVARRMAGAINRHVARKIRGENAAARRVRQLVAQLRRDLRAALLAEDWTPERLPALQLAANQVLARWRDGLNGEIVGWEELAWERGEAAVQAQLEVVSAVAMGMLSPLTQLQREMLAGLATDLIRNITDELRAKINAQLAMAVIGGITSTKAMQEIERILGLRDGARGFAYRVERIVRTELSRAYNTAANSSIRQAGGVLPGVHRRWVAWLDDRTRPTHWAAHGQRRRVDEPFEVGGARLMHPGDPAGPPEETINCRCTVILWSDDWGDFDQWYGKAEERG